MNLEVTRESLAAALQKYAESLSPAFVLHVGDEDVPMRDAILASLPGPAPEPPLKGYWEASGDLTPETAKSMRPILEQAARDGKQLVVHEGITLRWRAAQPAPDLDVERLERLIYDIYADHDQHRVGHPEHRGTCQDARPHPHDFARALHARLQARESGGEP